MKILITGGNKMGCTEDFYLRQQLRVCPSHYSLIRALRDMGHEVDQRIVDVGEDLSGYDEAIVFVTTPRSMVTHYFYNVLWTISQMPNCILAFDDWQADAIIEGFQQSCAPDEIFRDFFFDMSNTLSKADVEPHKEALMEAGAVVTSRSNRMLVSAFSSGDLSKIIDYPDDRAFQYNPNPYHLNRGPGAYSDVAGGAGTLEGFFGDADDDTISPADKEKKFNFASLVQGKTKKWLKDQNMSEWPVEFFGNRKLGQPRLTEGDMCRVFAKQWACLMPGYFHIGSGWWRARPLQVADAGSILIGDRDELFIYYNDEAMSTVTAGDLEAMDIDQLAAVAAGQKEALYASHPLDKQVEKDELTACLEATK